MICYVSLIKSAKSEFVLHIKQKLNFILFRHTPSTFVDTPYLKQIWCMQMQVYTKKQIMGWLFTSQKDSQKNSL